MSGRSLHKIMSKLSTKNMLQDIHSEEYLTPGGRIYKNYDDYGIVKSSNGMLYAGMRHEHDFETPRLEVTLYLNNDGKTWRLESVYSGCGDFWTAIPEVDELFDKWESVLLKAAGK